MLLLHLSDIHFRVPHCLNGGMDPERPYRTRLLQDVADRVQELGSVGAILVTGDVAFQANAQEYSTAFAWLKEVAEVSGCPMARIFVVPGNHDVDRKITAERRTRNSQKAIFGAADKENELRAQCADEHASQALFAPLANYNDFAKEFSCQIFPDRLSWIQDFVLDRGVKLRIVGLTTVLLSGIDGNDDAQGSLYLSPLQTALDPTDNCVTMILAHHPPDWLLDQDDVDDVIASRAALQFFGHKHRQRTRRETYYARFEAGAVNPDRREPGYKPGYNLIKLRVEGDGRDRRLKIEAHVLEFQTNPELFKPVIDGNRSNIFFHDLALPARTKITPSHVTQLPPQAHPAAENEISETEIVSVDVEASMGNISTRNLVFRFWNLSASQRRELATELHLLEDAELSLPEPERYGRAMLKAADRNLINEMAEIVARMESQR